MQHQQKMIVPERQNVLWRLLDVRQPHVPHPDHEVKGAKEERSEERKQLHAVSDAQSIARRDAIA
jgi:hypothetical protein